MTQCDAALRVPGGHRARDLGGQGARERAVGGLDDGDGTARRAGGRGELGADPARTDDHDVVLSAEDGTQPRGVVEGPQQMDAGDGPGAGQGDRLGAAGDDEDVVRDGSRLGFQFTVRGAQAGHFAAEPQPDVERLEVDVEGRALGLAQEDRLGKRRPVVRLVGFGANEGDGTGESLFAQGDGGLHPGHARPDDGHAPLLLCLLLAHPSTLRT